MRHLVALVAILGSFAVGLIDAARRVVTHGKSSPDDRPGAPQSAQEHASDPKQSLKRRATTIGAFLVALAVGGALVAVSGIMPIKASSGHWAITEWFLSFSMSRSVSTHSLGTKVPPLDEDHLVVKGARHYDLGCRPCHGSPELTHPRIAQAMTPHPPYLPSVLSQWDPAELFYIVKHGVKFTGMPAWPAQQRDDEVWAMAAFLLELPELDEQEYVHLARGNPQTTGATPPIEDLTSSPEPPRAVVENCSRCHGVHGLGLGLGAFPRLAGQSPTYMAAALEAYAGGERHSGIMEPIAAGLKPNEIRELASYYSNVETPDPLPDAEAADRAIERGEAIARRGIPTDLVPACIHCHGPADHPRNPAYPVLAGQYAEYLTLQLELFKEDHRGGSEYTHLMQPIADQLSPEQIRDVAIYYASLDDLEDQLGR